MKLRNAVENELKPTIIKWVTDKNKQFGRGKEIQSHKLTPHKKRTKKRENVEAACPKSRRFFTKPFERHTPF